MCSETCVQLCCPHGQAKKVIFLDKFVKNADIDLTCCLRCENMHVVLPPTLSEPVPRNTADYDGCIAKIIIVGE